MVIAVLGYNYLFLFAATSFGLLFLSQDEALGFRLHGFGFFLNRFFSFCTYNIRFFSFSVFRFLVTRKAIIRLWLFVCLVPNLFMFSHGQSV